MKEKELKFKGKIIRCVFNSENFKTYGVEVNKDDYPFIKFSKYGSATICGNLHELGIGQSYEIVATEQNTKYGYSYKVINIRKDRPVSENDIYIFLQEILTFNQASELWLKYPDIVDRVVNGNTKDIDLSKLKGIGEKTFESIKTKIIENYALCDLVIEFNGILTISMLKKLYDKYPSIQQLKNKLREDPYKCLCGLSHIGFITADSLLLKLEKAEKIEFGYDLKTSKQRCLSCILYLLQENETKNGSTKMDLRELRKQVIKHVPACANHFVECLKEDYIYYNKETMDVAIMSTFKTELEISNTIKYALKVNNSWDINWESYRNKGEFPLTDEQLDGLKNVCKYQISILCGNAGAGKTATTNTLIQMLLDNNKSFKLVASTGRAAKVLSGYTNMPAETIHRGYLYNPKNSWGINKDNKIDTDIVICDEFSMVDIFLFIHLLDGIDFSRTKLLMIGDNAQACSVAAGNCLNDMLNSSIIPTTKLNRVFRYGSGGLMTVATDTRNGKVFLDTKNKSDFIFFGNNKDYGFLQCSDDKIIQNCILLYSKLLQKGYKQEDILILSAQNKGDYGTTSINRQLQKIINKNYGSSKYMKIGEFVYYEGDLIIQCQNNYNAKIYTEDLNNGKSTTMCANGEIGRINKIENGYMIINFDGTLIQYYQSDLQNISLAYAISIHRSQGGGAKIVILLTPRNHTYINNSNLIYVGLTRTKEQCYHLGDTITINRSVKKKENLMRNTFLYSLLESN